MFQPFLMKKRSFVMATVMLFAFLMLMGCGGGKKEAGDEGPLSSEAAAQSIGGDVIGGVSISDDVPSRFPKEIPIPAEAQSIASMEQGDRVTVSFEVNKSFDETFQLYKEYLDAAGYQMENDTLIEDSYIGTGNLNGNTLTVLISMTTDDKQLSSVSLTYQFKT